MSEEQVFEVSWFDVLGDDEETIASLKIKSEKQRNVFMQRLIDEGYSPTYRLVPANMNEDDAISFKNDVIRVFTLSTSVNHYRLVKDDISDLYASQRDSIVYGVEVILFNSVVVNELRFDEAKLLNYKLIYPENIVDILYENIQKLLDAVDYSYATIKRLKEEGQLTIRNLLNDSISI